MTDVCLSEDMCVMCCEHVNFYQINVFPFCKTILQKIFSDIILIFSIL